MSQSNIIFDKAQRYIPGGVNSPVRAFKSVGGNPLFIARASGAYLFDADDKQYIDYVCSWGTAILGHAHPAAVRAVQEAASHGLSFGAPTEREVEMAAKICQLMPAIEQVRLVSSGTEATMSAIRLARAVTGRNKIIKFAGCYHGHADSLLVEAGSGGLTFGVPSSPGVPKALVQETCIATYNNLDSVEAWFQKVGAEIAAIIVEPVAGNMNCVLPVPGFLQGLRELCDQYQSLLIFDEVISGFRVGLHGAQAYYHVKPDLTSLGKVIGGGMPIAAFGGKKSIMEHMAPNGPVYQAGTLSGNPVAVASGLATLAEIEKPNFYQELTTKTEALVNGLIERAHNAGIPFAVNYLGGLFGLFFSEESEITHLDQVSRCDIDRFRKFFSLMLKEGIYLAPSAFEAGFMSIAHQDSDIQKTLNAAEKVFELL